MASRTAWTAGNGVGLTWSSLFNAADINSLANGSSVLSSVATIANGTNLDMYMDISARLTIASSTTVAGCSIALYLYPLLDNGTTLGDGSLTAGTQAAQTPGMAPVAMIPFFAGATQTSLNGSALGIVIPPGSFRFAVQNNSGFALAASGNTIAYRTYNINLNN